MLPWIWSYVRWVLLRRLVLSVCVDRLWLSLYLDEDSRGVCGVTVRLDS